VAWRRGRRFVALVAVVGFALGGGTAQAALAYGGYARVTTRAVLDNPIDGSDRARGRLDVRITHDAEVVASNLAAARSRCDDCRTVAVSFQVLLAGGKPTRVSVKNDSVAVNDHCTRCDVLALAYQFVVVSADHLSLTAGGYRELALARAELLRLLYQAPADAVIEAGVAAIAGKVRLVIANELRTSPLVRVRIDRPGRLHRAARAHFIPAG
jgi:hypothetical protein